jgi:hypothetical protein
MQKKSNEFRESPCHAPRGDDKMMTSSNDDDQLKGMMKMMNTTDLAAALETTPRELRKFLRSKDSGIEPVGKGSRYALPSSKREVNALQKRFNDWSEARNAPATDETPADD